MTTVVTPISMTCKSCILLIGIISNQIEIGLILVCFDFFRTNLGCNATGTKIVPIAEVFDIEIIFILNQAGPRIAVMVKTGSKE